MSDDRSLAAEATSSSSELAGTIWMSWLADGHGRPTITPAHVYELIQSPLMTYLQLQIMLHILYEGLLCYLMDGSTPGKRMVGSRVLLIDGACTRTPTSVPRTWL